MFTQNEKEILMREFKHYNKPNQFQLKKMYF